MGKEGLPPGVPAENEYHGLHWTAVLTAGLAVASLIWFAMTALEF